MRGPIVALCILSFLTFPAEGSTKADVVKALKKLQRFPPPVEGSKVIRGMDAKRPYQNERSWRYEGNFRLLKIRAKSQNVIEEVVLLTNGKYHAQVARSEATLGKWSLQSLVLKDNPAYQQEVSKWPVLLGLDVGPELSSEIITRLSGPERDAIKLTSSRGPNDLECMVVEIDLAAVEDMPVDRSVKLWLAKDFGYETVKLVESRGTSVQTMAQFDSWHRFGDRWYWKEMRAYAGTDNADPAKLSSVTELNVQPSGEAFDTSQCFLAYYGIPEPEINEWPWYLPYLAILIPVLGFPLAWWVHRKRGRRK